MLVFVRRGDWVFEAEIPAVDSPTSWIDAVGGGMARRELDWRVGEGMLNQFLANADAETKERAQAALDRGGNPKVIHAQLNYEMELLMAEAQTGMKGIETEPDKELVKYHELKCQMLKDGYTFLNDKGSLLLFNPTLVDNVVSIAYGTLNPIGALVSAVYQLEASIRSTQYQNYGDGKGLFIKTRNIEGAGYATDIYWGKNGEFWHVSTHNPFK